MNWHLIKQTPDYPKYPDDNYCIDCGAPIPANEIMCERCKLLEEYGDQKYHDSI